MTRGNEPRDAQSAERDCSHGFVSIDGLDIELSKAARVAGGHCTRVIMTSALTTDIRTRPSPERSNAELRVLWVDKLFVGPRIRDLSVGLERRAKRQSASRRVVSFCRHPCGRSAAVVLTELTAGREMRMIESRAASKVNG